MARATTRVERLPHVDPVATELKRTRLDPGHRQQVADHPVEVLRLFLNLIQQIPPGMLWELRPEVEQAGRRAEDGRERRAEIMADRGQQRVTHPFRLGRRVGRHDLPRQPCPLQGGRRQLRHRLDQGADLGIERGPVESDAQTPTRPWDSARAGRASAPTAACPVPAPAASSLLVGPAGRRGRAVSSSSSGGQEATNFNGVAVGQEDRRGPVEIAVELPAAPSVTAFASGKLESRRVNS